MTTIILFAVVVFFLCFVFWILKSRYRKWISYFSSLVLAICSFACILFTVYHSYIKINLFDSYLINLFAQINIYLLVPALFFVLLIRHQYLVNYEFDSSQVLDKSVKTLKKSSLNINQIFCVCTITYLLLVYLPISSTEYNFSVQEIIGTTFWLISISILWFKPKIGKWLFLVSGLVMLLPFTISNLLYYTENKFVFDSDNVNTLIMIASCFILLTNLQVILNKLT